MSDDITTISVARLNLVKQLNCSAIYQLIDSHGPVSRIKLAELSQLAPASITKISRLLLDRGLIKEVEQQASTGGRRAISIVTETQSFQVIALRLGRHHSTLNLFSLDGQKLAEKRCVFTQTTQEQLQSALIVEIESFITLNKPIINELIALSVILPGLIDTKEQVVNYMPHMKVANWGLAQNLEQHFSIKTFVGHDIRSMALAEHYFGATNDCSDSILISIDRGVGAGIMINNQLFSGAKGNVGEMGHIQIDPLGDRCHCGNFGCLETFISNPAIESRAKLLLNKGYQSHLHLNHCDINAICHEANAHDELATELIHLVGNSLGKAIAMVINLFNPQKIVIIGAIMQAENHLLPIVNQAIQKQILKEFYEHTSITSSKLDHSSAIGAFALVRQALLEGSLLQHLLVKEE